MTENETYVLLGEGDFTYSLDMCRYISLSSLPSEEHASPSASSPAPSTISITCTGVDTLQELQAKYKDVDFVWRSIRSCCNDNGVKSASLAGVTILHGINAVQAKEEDDTNTNKSSGYNHVIFNHPHIGTEDAQLHSRFLQHFFYASTKRWMKPPNTRSLLYLTLVNGQCERWKCIEGARKFGLRLVRRSEFVPPPQPLQQQNCESWHGDKTYYELRRHQSGRSFANRRRMQGGESIQLGTQKNDSETLVFARECDYPTNTTVDDGGDGNSSVGLLPWEKLNDYSSPTGEEVAASGEALPAPSTSLRIASDDHSNINSNAYQCKYCSKSFQEERSLKNHMICSHPDCKEVIAWKLGKSKKKKNKKRKLKEATEQGSTQQFQCSAVEKLNAVPTACDLQQEGPPWICTICNPAEQRGEAAARAFPHYQALLDHQRAKHSGVHTDIKPDWYRIEDNGKSKGAISIGACSICDLSYSTEEEKQHHEMEFVPTPSVVADMLSMSQQSSEKNNGDNAKTHPHYIVNNQSYKCCHCSKTFRELRAQRQHENFCSQIAH